MPLAILMSYLALGLVYFQAQAGSFDGKIVDSAGKSVEGVHVSVMSLDQRESGIQRETLSDVYGRFIMRDIKPDHYRIYLRDETHGVPDNRAIIFQSAHQRFPEIEVHAGQTSHFGLVPLPPSLKKLEIVLLDANTNKPLPLARCHLERYKNPSIMYATDSTSGKFEFWLPPEPISIKITSAGYKDWLYSSSYGAETFVSLESDLTLVAKLHRSKND